MSFLCQEVNTYLQGYCLIHVQELGLKKWIFSFEKAGKTKELLICAQTPFSRFHLMAQRTGGKETLFTKALEERVLGCVFQSVEMLGDDRILGLKLQKKAEVLLFIAELCFKHPKVVLVDPSQRVLASWEPIEEQQYQFPNRTNAHILQPVSIDSAQVEKKYRDLEEKSAFAEQVQNAATLLNQRLKKARRRLEQYQSDLEEGKRWQEEAHMGDLLQSNFFRLKRGMTELTVEDWENENQPKTIPLDPSLEPQEAVKRYFKRSRKFKKKGEIALDLIKRAEDEIDVLKGFLARLKGISTELELQSLCKEAKLIKSAPKQKQKTVEKTHPYREFTTEAGLKIFIGRNDEDNDTLSFSFARGNDLWFHAANVAGSHVVLRVPKGKEVDNHSLQDALQLAIHFSKARDTGDDEVTMTECKYLSKSKGSKPGTVNVSKHKIARARKDPKRMQRLLGKLVSD